MKAGGIGDHCAALAHTTTVSFGPTWSLNVGLSAKATLIRAQLCGSSPHSEEPSAPGTGQDCGAAPSVIGGGGSGVPAAAYSAARAVSPGAASTARRNASRAWAYCCIAL